MPRCPWQKHLSDASEEVAKTERLNLYTQGKTKSSSPSSPTTPPQTAAQSEHTAAAMQTEEEARAKLKDIAGIYAAILVKYTNYANTQQERQFFETLYDFSARVLFTINDRKRWHAIENELGRIFRSEHFNLSMRKNEQHAAKPMRCKELYELKQQADPLARPAKEAPTRRSSIHAAMHLRSPVISTIFPTPKEMMIRAAEEARAGSMHSEPARASAADKGGAALPTGARFGNSVREAAREPAQPQSGQHTQRSAREEPLTSEEAIDAEIAQATDAFNSLVGS